MSLSVRDLTKRFGGVAVVDDVRLEAAAGAFVVIVGPSGCGKSTLLRLIAGLERPDRGAIAIAGRTVVDQDRFQPPEARRVGVVFQSYALWPHLNARDNVAFPYEARGVDRRAAREAAAGHLATVEMSAFAERLPDALSGGQRQRVALARCLAGETDLILLDEPLANLDPHLRAAMERELRAFHERAGKTTFYITHDQREAMALADQMAVMREGKFLQIGPPQVIYDRPQSEAVARFVGRGAVLPAMLETGAATVLGQSAPVRMAEDQPQGPAALFVRPRDLAVGEDGLRARLRSILYRGGVWEAEAELEAVDEPLALELDRPAQIGETLGVVIRSGWVLPA